MLIYRYGSAWVIKIWYEGRVGLDFSNKKYSIPDLYGE